MENTSGQGSTASVPAEVDKWNWGAFLLSWIWGIGNNTYIAFLMFVPFVNIVMPFVLGAKGSIWAWRNKRWESVEHFRRVQRKWSQWALIIYCAMFLLFGAMIFGVMYAMKSSDAYRMAVQAVKANQQVVAILGEPISTGLPTGSFQVSGPSGFADVSFSVKGSKESGTMYFQATRSMGRWEITHAVIELDGTGQRIDLVEPSGARAPMRGTGGGARGEIQLRVATGLMRSPAMISISATISS